MLYSDVYSLLYTISLTTDYHHCQNYHQSSHGHYQTLDPYSSGYKVLKAYDDASPLYVPRLSCLTLFGGCPCTELPANAV